MSTLASTFDLTGRVAVVTGGAGLLGRQFCRTLAEAGASVLVADMDKVAAQKVADEIVAWGWKSVPQTTDVGDPKSVEEMTAVAIKTFGKLDILVNSAALDPKFDQHGRGKHGSAFEDYPLPAWDAAIRVNLTGAFLCSQAAVKAMLKQGGGVIINICSTYGLVGPDHGALVHRIALADLNGKGIRAGVPAILRLRDHDLRAVRARESTPEHIDRHRRHRYTLC